MAWNDTDVNFLGEATAGERKEGSKRELEIGLTSEQHAGL